MGNPAYIYTNLVKQSGAAKITVVNESTPYPKAALIDQRIDKPMRFTAKTGNSITVDMTDAHAVTYVWIGRHNFTPNVTATFSMGSSSACSSYSIAVPYAITNMAVHFASQSYAFCKLVISDSTHGTFPELSEFIVGEVASFSSKFSYGWMKGAQYVNDVHQTEFGSAQTYERYSVRTRRFNFVNRPAALETEMEAMFATAKGSLNPIVIVPDLAINFSLFGYLQGNYQASNVEAGSDLYTTGFDFVECSPGKVLA